MASFCEHDYEPSGSNKMRGISLLPERLSTFDSRTMFLPVTWILLPH
jgi:hypothetical protein